MCVFFLFNRIMSFYPYHGFWIKSYLKKINKLKSKKICPDTFYVIEWKIKECYYNLKKKKGWFDCLELNP